MGFGRGALLVGGGCRENGALNFGTGKDGYREKTELHSTVFLFIY